jgi:hypothetical protein
MRNFRSVPNLDPDQVPPAPPRSSIGPARAVRCDLTMRILLAAIGTHKGLSPYADLSGLVEQAVRAADRLIELTKCSE